MSVWHAHAKAGDLAAIIALAKSAVIRTFKSFTIAVAYFYNHTRSNFQSLEVKLLTCFSGIHNKPAQYCEDINNQDFQKETWAMSHESMKVFG